MRGRLLLLLWVTLGRATEDEEGSDQGNSILRASDGIPNEYLRDKQFLAAKRSLPRTLPLPIPISLHLSLESITDITNSDTTMDLYMTQTWPAPANHNRSLKLSGEDIANYCWTPDTYFILAKRVIYDSMAQSLSFTTDQQVVFDQKIRVTAPCNPEIWYFPFDNSKCRIILSSYGFSDKDVFLNWTGGGVSFPVEYDSLGELGYVILNMTTKSYLANYGPGLDFVVLEADIAMQRISSIYLYQVYVPAASLVLVSWVTFWINGDKTGTPARASVGVMTVLSMLTICRSQNDIGNVISREPSLLDIYIWASFSFVIAAMIEFALSDFYRDPNFGAQQFHPLHVPRYRKTNLKIDKAARIMFPTSFALFNLVYWSYVIHHQSSTRHEQT